MKIYVKNAQGLEIESDITDKELTVILQASDRGLLRNAKVAVMFDGSRRYLEVEAIDRRLTLPNVVFSGYTVPPPDPDSAPQATFASLRHSPC